MKEQNSKWLLLVSALSAAATFLVPPLRAEVLEKSKQVDHSIVHYKVVLPNDYDPAKTYPAILAFGGGPQTMNTMAFSAAISAPRRKSAAISLSRRRRPTAICSSRMEIASSPIF